MTTHLDPSGVTAPEHAVHRPAGRPVAAALLVTGLLGTAGERTLTVWHPLLDADGRFPYDRLVEIRTTWWAMHFFGGVAVVLLSVAVGACGVVLCRDRGRVWAAMTAVLLTLGGALFGAGLAAEGASMAYGAATGIAGQQVVDHIFASPGWYLAGIGPGGALQALGTVTLCVALWRARAVPRWLVGVLLVGLVVGAVWPFGLLAAIASTTLTSVPFLALLVLAARRLASARPDAG